MMKVCRKIVGLLAINQEREKLKWDDIQMENRSRK